MRRLLRALLVVLVVLVILVGGLFVAGHFYLTSDSARRRVASRLEEVYGGPVEIDEADLGVLGDSTLRGLRLYEAGKAGEAPWATFGTVKTDVSVLDLARGVMPRRITVDDASMTLRIDRSGRLLMHLPEGATRSREGALPDIHVEGYKNVRIVLTTHATGGISDADVDLARAIDLAEAPPQRG